MVSVSLPDGTALRSGCARKGYDLADRFRLAAAAIAALSARPCAIDPEAVTRDAGGLAVYDPPRCRRQDHSDLPCTFDLIDFNAEDLRPRPIEKRKHVLARWLRRPHDDIAFNEHFESDGAIVFKQASALGDEDIVSKRRGARSL
jgi:ATP-dependent DNA ligase